MNKTQFTGVKHYPTEYTYEDVVKYAAYHLAHCVYGGQGPNIVVTPIEMNVLFMDWLKEHKIEKWIEMTRNFKIEQILK